MRSNRDDVASVIESKIEKAISTIEAFVKANTADHSSPKSLEITLSELKKGMNAIAVAKVSEAAEGILQNFVDTIDEKLTEQHPKNITELLHAVRDSLIEVHITHPTFEVPNQSIKLNEVAWEDINRICFRGDDRDPGKIFESGLLPKMEDDKVEDDGFGFGDPAPSLKEVAISGPYVSTKNVVAVSSRLAAAAFFPINNDVKEGWIYVVKVEKGFNTHAHGYNALVEKGLTKDYADVMYVHEINVEKIPKENIIAAIKVKRNPSDQPIDPNHPYAEQFKAYGRYNLVDYKVNPNCTVSASEKKVAIGFIEAEIQHNKMVGGHEMASPQSAYQKNTMFAGVSMSQPSVAMLVSAANIPLAELKKLTPNVRNEILGNADKIVQLTQEGKLQFSDIASMQPEVRKQLFTKVNDVIEVTKQMAPERIKDISSKQWEVILNDKTSTQAKSIIQDFQKQPEPQGKAR